MQVYYDDYCAYCQWFMRFCLKYDYANRIEFLPISSSQFPDEKYRLKALEVIVGYDSGKWYYADATIMQILRKLPRFAILYYLLFPFWKIGLSALIYKQIAKKRKGCNLRKIPSE